MKFRVDSPEGNKLKEKSNFNEKKFFVHSYVVRPFVRIRIRIRIRIRAYVRTCFASLFQRKLWPGCFVDGC